MPNPESPALPLVPQAQEYWQNVADRIIETDGCVAHDWLVGVAKQLRVLAEKPLSAADLVVIRRALADYGGTENWAKRNEHMAAARELLSRLSSATAKAASPASDLRAALLSVQHNRTCSCYGSTGPCPRCIVGYDAVDAALHAPKEP